MILIINYYKIKVKDPRKIKKMSKKQRRMLAKRDVTKVDTKQLD